MLTQRIRRGLVAIGVVATAAGAVAGVGLAVQSQNQPAQAYTCVYVPSDLYNPWHCTSGIVPKGRI